MILNFGISGNMVDISILLYYSVAMKLDYDTAASLLSQLGNITRLKIVRELVRAGEGGMPVGKIRNVLDIPNSTLSHHLSHLRSVGLVRQEREGTVLRCFVNRKAVHRPSLGCVVGEKSIARHSTRMLSTC